MHRGKPRDRAAAALPPATGAETRTAVRSRGRAFVGWLRGIPPESIVVGLGLFAVLVAFVSADPASGVSWSSGALGDEYYNVISARNFALFGRWATDAWDHHLVNLPFSLMSAADFELFGVGIGQARMMTITFVSLTAVALVWGMRGAVGRLAALFAGLSFATSGLILYYGRLAFLEDLVVLALTLGVLVLARKDRLSIRGGMLAGFCLAIAIGTKPNSAFEVLGIIVALAAVWGWRDRAMRRWLLGACLTIAAAGLAWTVVIFLPNREAVVTDIQIWMPGEFYLAPGELARSIGSYAHGNNDGLYGMLLGPLIVLSAIGVVSMLALRRRVSADEARLAVAAFGWAAFGFGVLMITSYRPNRYVVPLVPALSILACIGLRVVMSWIESRHNKVATGPAAQELSTPERGSAPAGAAPARPRSRARLAPRLIAALVIAFAISPGLYWYATWAPNATYQLADINDQYARGAPPNVTIAGNNAAQFLFLTKNPLVVTGIANNGDFYASGVRWYLAPVDAGPPPGVPASAWAARQATICVKWRDLRVQCLYHVP